MKTLHQFKNEIVLGSIVVALICEVVSLFFLGWNQKFIYGLLLGTCISILNFSILAFTLNKVFNGGNKLIVIFGYLLRLGFYGAAIVTAFKANHIAGFACMFGFITVKVAIYYLHGLKPKFSKGRKVRPEVQAEFEKEDLEKQLKKEGKR